MKFYNTFSKIKENFIPIKENKVKIYSCGPTVYDYIHIGNARPLCVFDTLRRYLKYCGFDVTFVQNFTDIDDKIIKKANENNRSSEEIAKFYTEEYQKDASGLNIIPADIHPTATSDIKNIINFICNLMKNNYAYKISTGDVYFRVSKFKQYGRLSGQFLKNLKIGSRVEKNLEKEEMFDFVLWKNAKPNEPFWEAPWGKGRPGWHIECSSMIKSYLGETIDIHCGGQDLCFPHHENEIAQSQSLNKKPLANFWLHNGFVNVDNEKMSKSLNNFFTVREIAEKFGYESIRYFMISSHYRSPINYSLAAISSCKSALDRLKNCKKNLENAIKSCKKNDEKFNKESILQFKKIFIESLNNDLNTADSLASLFDLTYEINTKILKNPTIESLKFSEKIFNELTNILGILQNKEKNEINNKIKKLIKEREKARNLKDFKTADKIRDEIDKMGITLKDTSNGSIWSFK